MLGLEFQNGIIKSNKQTLVKCIKSKAVPFPM